MFLYLITKFLYKSDLYPRARIGSGLLLVHGFDVVVGADAVLGKDVVIFNGVSVGKKNVGVVSAGMPKIGDDCVLGTGAKILGPIQIGDSVTIGANSVVIKNVASHSVCAGNPAKVLTNKSDSQ
jgi:serine O-acetyltransferase